MTESVEPLDDNPPFEHIQRIADLQDGVRVTNAVWLSDKSSDFYLGMFATMRIVLSGINTLKKNTEMNLDDLEWELMLFNGEIAVKIIEKH